MKDGGAEGAVVDGAGDGPFRHQATRIGMP